MSINNCTVVIKNVHPVTWASGGVAAIALAAVIIGALGLILGGKLGAIGTIGNSCFVGGGGVFFLLGFGLFTLGCQRAQMQGKLHSVLSGKRVKIVDQTENEELPITRCSCETDVATGAMYTREDGQNGIIDHAGTIGDLTNPCGVFLVDMAGHNKPEKRATYEKGLWDSLQKNLASIDLSKLSELKQGIQQTVGKAWQGNDEPAFSFMSATIFVNAENKKRCLLAYAGDVSVIKIAASGEHQMIHWGKDKGILVKDSRTEYEDVEDVRYHNLKFKEFELEEGDVIWGMTDGVTDPFIAPREPTDEMTQAQKNGTIKLLQFVSKSASPQDLIKRLKEQKSSLPIPSAEEDDLGVFYIK